MGMRLVTYALVALLALIQAGLWFGERGMGSVIGQQAQLDAQQALNDAARARNERLAAEVRDLKEGLEMVEEKARFELGMIRPDEILVQYTARR